MKKHAGAKVPVLILCALLLAGLLSGMTFPVPPDGQPSTVQQGITSNGSTLWESQRPDGSGSSDVESSASKDSSVPEGGSIPPEPDSSGGSSVPADGEPDSSSSRPPLGASAGTVTVTDVAQGGLAAAVTAANGGSTDFSALRELHVSGTLNTNDLYFLQGLGSLQTLDLAGCGVSAMNAVPGGLFRDHTSLVTVNMPGKGSYVMPSNLFAGCTSLVTADVSRATSFGSSVFSGCSSLQTPVMPTVYTIENATFQNCTSLASFDASRAGVIGGSAFAGCTSLSSINLGGTQKTIQDYAFSGCSSLASITFPTGSRLGNYAFGGCTALAGVDLAGVTLTGSGAFWNCTALQGFTPTADANLPAYTFGNCTALVSADLVGFRSFGEGAFSGCSVLQSASLPASYALAPSLFQNCMALRAIDLSGASSIPRSAFASCLALQEVRMPLAPYAIGDNAFAGCESLEEIDLSGATTVGANAFNSCRHLYDITWPASGFGNTTPGNYAFALTAQDFSKGFPAGSGITGANVARVAPSQTPRVYFMLPNGGSGTVPQGEVFDAPYRLQTQYGTEYAEMCADPAYDGWRIVGLEEPDVTPHVSQGGAPLPGVDTNVPGTYAIRYTIPNETFSNTHTLDYTLTVLADGSPSSSQDDSPVASSGASGPASSSASPSGGSDASTPASSAGAPSERAGSSSSDIPAGGRPDFDGTPAAPVAVGEEFILTPAVIEKLRQDGWTWENEYLACRIEDGVARCLAMRPGQTYVAYTLRSGYLFRVEITIVEKTHGWVWPLVLLLLLAGGGLCYYLWRRGRQRRKPAGSPPKL